MITLKNIIITRETDRAWLLEDVAGNIKVWVPKNQVQARFDPLRDRQDRAARYDLESIAVAEWIVTEKNLSAYIDA